jgi:glycine cleavage system regulatory protein
MRIPTKRIFGMDQHWILSVLSDDRPGVIKQIAERVANHGGNWLESRLTQLAGKFAGVIRVNVPVTATEELRQALLSLTQVGINVQVEALQQNPTGEPIRNATFSAIGPDRPGIVLEITQALTEYNINIAELNTNCSSAPYSGDPLFAADGVLSVPRGTNVEQLCAQLERIADTLGIDISLEEQ